MKNLFRCTLMILFIASLSACSSDDDGGSGGGSLLGDGNNRPGGQQGGTTVGGTVAEPDTDEIQNNNYALKGILSFANASEDTFQDFAGNEVKRFSYFFANKIEIPEDKFSQFKEACRVWVQASPDTKKEDVEFQPGELLFVQVSHAQTDGEFEVSIVLQEGIFQQFFVTCMNTENSTEMGLHVGHLLEITPKL